MKKIVPLFIYPVLFLWFLTSCKNQSDQYFPKALYDTIPIEVVPSTFNIPIHYSLSELEEFLNGKIKAEFLETVISPTKNEKDQVKIEMKKAGRIQLSAIGNELQIVFPLEVTATVLQSRANFLTKGIKPVVTTLKLTLQTPANLDSRWNLVTHFSLKKTEWIQEPVVRFAGIPINLTQKVEGLLDKNKSKLTEMVDESINKSVSLAKPIGKIWTDLQKPMIINKKPPSAYLKFVTKQISGNINVFPTELVCYTSINAVVAMVNESNIRVPIVPLPSFKQGQLSKSKSNVYIYAFAEMERLNETLKEKLDGFRIQKDSKTIIFKDPFIYASDSGLAIDIKTAGNVEGHILATVQPFFDTANQRFQLNNFQFRVATDNWLLNLGDAILHDKLRDTLQTFLTIEADSLIGKVPNIIENAIAKGKTGKTIDVDVRNLKIHSCDIKMDARRLHFIVHTTFASDLEIKHLKSGKQIKIKPKSKPAKNKPDE